MAAWINTHLSPGDLLFPALCQLTYYLWVSVLAGHQYNDSRIDPRLGVVPWGLFTQLRQWLRQWKVSHVALAQDVAETGERDAAPADLA